MILLINILNAEECDLASLKLREGDAQQAMIKLPKPANKKKRQSEADS
jgi:hypothetical protein